MSAPTIRLSPSRAARSSCCKRRKRKSMPFDPHLILLFSLFIASRASSPLVPAIHQPDYQLNYRQQSMKQKSLSLQEQRPKMIKLTPFTALPKLRLTSLGSPCQQITVQPFISGKSKAKTSPSEGDFRREERIKTEQAKEEESTSFRLISRFVFNHLQKKLTFQAQTCSNYQDSLPDGDTATIDSERRFRQEAFNYDHSRGQSYISNPIKEASCSQILKLKNKLSLRAKALQRLANESRPQRNRNRYANIDSYFDLSCLDSCQQRGR